MTGAAVGSSEGDRLGETLVGISVTGAAVTGA
jgi:hypothetical protein